MTNSASNSSPRKSKRAARALAVALIGLSAGIGVAAGFLLGRNGPEASTDPELGAVWLVVFVLGAVVGLFAVLLTHEVGHILAGLLVRFRFFLLILGPFRVSREGDSFRLGLNRSLALAGGLAGTAPVVGDLQRLPTRLATMVAGGPAASLVLGGLSLSSYYMLGLSTAVEPSLVILGHLIWLYGIVSLGIAFVTLIPGRTSGFLTDGARLLQIYRGGAAAEADIALVTLLARGLAGIRPRDWEPELVRETLRAPPGPFLTIAYHMAWRHAADAGLSADAERYRAMLVDQIEGAPSVVRPALKLDLATDRALAGDVSFARALVEESHQAGAILDPHARPLAEAALAAVEGRSDAALRAAQRAEALLERSMDPSARVVDGERIARICALVR